VCEVVHGLCIGVLITLGFLLGHAWRCNEAKQKSQTMAKTHVTIFIYFQEDGKTWE
jgi:hypothetical protein